MLFNLTFNNAGNDGGNSFIVNASSWSNCLSYAEGTGKEIQGISKLINDNFILNDASLNGCFQVLLKDITTSEVSNTIIYDTLANVYTWTQNQSGKEVVSLQFQKKTYVAI
jgi:hypothetical protein